MENLKVYQTYSKNNELFDFIFIGLGASNSLILLSLIKEGCITNKKIAIIEPDLKANNDKTYCFWASPKDSIVRDLNSIISYHYTSLEVNGSVLQNIENQPYYYIKSIDLYNFTLDAVLTSNISIYRHAVEAVSCEEEIYSIKTSNRIFNTQFILDSRPPILSQISPNEIYLNQSFYGLHIKCEKEVFLQKSFEMMDFNVDQNKYTQFVYTLPFSPYESLVELTRFGSDKIDLNYAKEILHKKLKNDYGNYVILSDESGCIPMTTFYNPPSKNKGILHTGASANLIKPSTGYGFKNMFEFAKLVTERISAENFKQFNLISLESKKRFRFYDALLLIILFLWPSEGKKIFTRLFKSQKICTVFSFLDEKTTLLQEIKIFASLPILPFLRALFIYIRKLNWLRYTTLFLSVLLYFLVTFFSTDLAVNISYFIIVIGLILIGIPHGAVDHLLQKDKKIALFPFVLKYLFLVVLYFIIWHYFPLFSLIFFIIYSSFHFGESELEEVGIRVVSFSSYLKAFLMGFSILLFIIFTHFNESIIVISGIEGLQFPKTFENEFIVNPYLIASLAFLYILSHSLFKKNQSHLTLLVLILLGIKLPLIIAFALYFICQHSYNAWRHLQIGLSMNAVSLYKKALPYTLGALLIFIAMLIPSSNKFHDTEGLIGYFFIFLACISLPHFILMHLFYKKTGSH